jgi:hypothetical protein
MLGKMKFHFIDPKSVASLVPPWAADHFALASTLDRLIGDMPGKTSQKRMRPEFWVEIHDNLVDVRTAIDDNDIESAKKYGWLWIDCPSPVDGSECRIELSLLELFRGNRSVTLPYTVYQHSFGGVERQHTYVGITKRPWHKRLSEHRAAAQAGSKLLFHRALRANEGRIRLHRIFLSNLSYDAAMTVEEDFVQHTLYPEGLNMIPGGMAGLAYLAKMGFAAKTAEDREASLRRLLETERLEGGQPNPLCAARWASDQEFVNSVICRPAGRLSLQQVRDIRIGASFGKPLSIIATEIGDRTDRVRRVVSGRRYGRVL